MIRRAVIRNKARKEALRRERNYNRQFRKQFTRYKL